MNGALTAALDHHLHNDLIAIIYSYVEFRGTVIQTLFHPSSSTVYVGVLPETDPTGQLILASHDGVVSIWKSVGSNPTPSSHQWTDTINGITVLSDNQIAIVRSGLGVSIFNRHTNLTILVTSREIVTAMIAFPDGRLAIAINEYPTARIEIWSPTRPLMAVGGHTHQITAMCVMPDGRLVSGSGDMTVRIWDLALYRWWKPWSWMASAVLTGHTKEVLAVAVLPDGRIVSGSWDKTIRVWNNDGTSLVLRGHTGGVMALAVLPDGRIASGSWDTTIRIWRVSGSSYVEVIILKRHHASVNRLVVLPDGHLISVDIGNVIYVWG